MIKIMGIVGRVLGAVYLAMQGLHPSIQNNGHCPRQCTLAENLPMFALEKLQSSILRVMKKEIRIGRRKRFREKGLDIKL